MPFKHYAALVIWDNALPEGWELNDEHTNWPTNPVLDGLPYRLESKRYNDAVYILNIEAVKKTNQMTDMALEAKIEQLEAPIQASGIKYEVRYNAVTKVYEDGKYEFLITSADELTTNLAVSVLNSETAELRQKLASLQEELAATHELAGKYVNLKHNNEKMIAALTSIAIGSSDAVSWFAQETLDALLPLQALAPQEAKDEAQAKPEAHRCSNCGKFISEAELVKVDWLHGQFCSEACVDTYEP